MMAARLQLKSGVCLQGSNWLALVDVFSVRVLLRPNLCIIFLCKVFQNAVEYAY